MARSQFYDVAIDSQGNTITTAQCTVYTADTTNKPTIFSEATGSTPKSNPFTTSSGMLDFFAEPGEYDLVIEDTNSPANFATKTIRWQSVPFTGGVYSQTLAEDALGPGYGMCVWRRGSGSSYVSVTAPIFQQVFFDSTLLDVSNCFSSFATSAYIAPVTGYYEFDVHLIVSAPNASSASPSRNASFCYAINGLGASLGFDGSGNAFNTLDRWFQANVPAGTSKAIVTKNFKIRLNQSDYLTILGSVPTPGVTLGIDSLGTELSVSLLARAT